MEAKRLEVGDVVEDVTLPDHTGASRKLSELVGENGLVLILYRGDW